MNKIVLTFVILVVVFCGCWVFKSKSPINRNIVEAQEVSNWWDTDDEIEPLSKEVSEEWYLDPRIPSDYVPVLGQDGLYMQIDNDGTIISYWKCTEEENKLTWEKVNPDIPDNYEPVEGLDDVYKITDSNGISRYYQYIRNRDNSFTFVEVDKHGNIIDEYIVNCETEAASTNSIPTNYMQIDGNVYAVKNSEGVVVGFKEKNEDENGNYVWSPVSKDKVNIDTNTGRNHNVVTNKQPSLTTPQATVPAVTTTVPEQTTLPDVTKTTTSEAGTTTRKSTKTHTQKETYQEVKYEGDYKCTYESIIIRTYDDYGNLISTETEGPYLIDKQYAGQNPGAEVDKNLIEANIDNEILRVTQGLQSSEDTAKIVINSLNAERASNNLRALSTGGDAQKIAIIFAADMAKYDNTSSSSPMYGTIDQLLSRYNIKNQGYGLNVWRTTTNNASEIHKRFQSIDSCRTARMNENFNCVGVAVYYNNGFYYIAEVLLLQ